VSNVVFGDSVGEFVVQEFPRVGEDFGVGLQALGLGWTSWSAIRPFSCSDRVHLRSAPGVWAGSEFRSFWGRHKPKFESPDEVFGPLAVNPPLQNSQRLQRRQGHVAKQITHSPSIYTQGKAWIKLNCVSLEMLQAVPGVFDDRRGQWSPEKRRGGREEGKESRVSGEEKQRRIWANKSTVYNLANEVWRRTAVQPPGDAPNSTQMAPASPRRGSNRMCPKICSQTIRQLTKGLALSTDVLLWVSRKRRRGRRGRRASPRTHSPEAQTDLPQRVMADSNTTNWCYMKAGIMVRLGMRGKSQLVADVTGARLRQTLWASAKKTWTNTSPSLSTGPESVASLRTNRKDENG